jgi:hypothetical protein
MTIPRPDQEQGQYDSAYKEAEEQDERPADITTIYSKFVSPLGLKLQGLFEDAERNRDLSEQRWLKDLRQYRAEYDPEVLAKLHPKRSKAFLGLTRSKTKTITSLQPYHGNSHPIRNNARITVLMSLRS